MAVGFIPAGHPYAPRYQPQRMPEITFNAHPKPDVKEEALQAYHFLGPFQAMGLFGAGAAGSLAFRWFVKGLMQKPLTKVITEMGEKKTNLTFSQGLPAVIKYIIQEPHLKNSLLAYGSAIALGYGALSLAQGYQEEFVRREETCIRANLLQRLTTAFRTGIEKKLLDENKLRGQATEQLRTLLKKNNLNPDHYIHPSQFIPSTSTTLSYPSDPKPLTHPMPLAALRFGQPSPNSATHVAMQMSPSPNQINGFKVFDVLAGLATGLLVQGLFMLQHNPGKMAKTETTFFIKDMEAMFLDKDWRPLALTLGLSALAKGGKMATDGYREINVTRKNADTELAYQEWLEDRLDPENRKIAEETSWKDHYDRFAAALPYNVSNPAWIKQSIQVLLDNIGRSSAPVYMAATWPVSLTPARG